MAGKTVPFHCNAEGLMLVDERFIDLLSQWVFVEQASDGTYVLASELEEYEERLITVMVSVFDDMATDEAIAERKGLL